ncbi:ATP-binding protein [Azospirillum sp.]|uniref:ATP-binding protein n=1 Tax=Azospirillum sp. TaxID=34012 RepID=UPI002D748B06|nr:ATP-binding protein [Azospirillum sp.]HYF88439.1 ATP-binding protein [Azospirillum sp.]
MDRVRNPYAPGAGNPPPELAGRSSVLDDARVALQRIAIGRAAQSSILVGLRGVGKTVLLVRIKEIAEEQSYKTHIVEAHEAKPFAELIAPGLRSLLLSLSRFENGKDKVRRGLRVLKSFLGSIKVKVGELDIELGIESETGVADSGDIEVDLPNLFLAVGDAAKAVGCPVALFVDELQYLSEKEFSALIMSIHKISQAQLPLTLIGAGLPQILGLAGESKSYSERLFRYPKIGALDEIDAEAAIAGPAIAEGASFKPEAIKEILRVTERYPYFLQQWAHDAWNIASGPSITYGDVVRATDISIRTLDESFFRVRFDRCTPSEKRYMRALAEFGPGAHRSGDVADCLGLKTTSVGPTRGKLIKKGMIYSPQHGDTAFTVPLFDSYMRRVMPTLE